MVTRIDGVTNSIDDYTSEMPIQRIEVSEYQCIHCNYKWINRVNGKDGPIPKKCARCKRPNWNTGNNMSPKEVGLRRRVQNLYSVYHDSVWRLTDPSLEPSTFSVDDHLDRKVVTRFLNLDPRPTIEELRQVLFSPEIKLGLSSQNLLRKEAWVPNPEKPGWFKHDRPPYHEYLKLVKADAQRQQEIMQQVIQSRLSSQGQEKEGGYPWQHRQFENLECLFAVVLHQNGLWP
jgi:hypothetical protein